jgi:DUF1009 family protein
MIAGNGVFPVLFARGARKAGLSVVAAALRGEADKGLAAEVDELFWVYIGQIGKAAKEFVSRGVGEAAFVGGIGKLKAFRNARPDLPMLRAVARLRHFNDDALLRSIAQSFEEEGVQIIASTRYLAEVLAPAGALSRKRPSATEEKDIALGRQVAEAIGRADVGQTVVVKGGHVIAVEAAEGTDPCIARAGVLAGPGIVVVKRCKPRQDERFDLPAIGPGTVAAIALAKGAALCIEAGKTVVLEADRVREIADEAGIAVIAQ